MRCSTLRHKDALKWLLSLESALENCEVELISIKLCKRRDLRARAGDSPCKRCQRTMSRQFARNDCLIHIDHRLKSNFRDDAISDSKLTAIMCGISRLECEPCQRSLHVSLTIREREEIIQAARHSLIADCRLLSNRLVLQKDDLHLGLR